MEEPRSALPFKEPPYFQMFRETCAMLDRLPNEAFIPVIRAGFAFFLRGEIIDLPDPVTQAVLECFLMTIQRSMDAYNKNRIYGSMGGKLSHQSKKYHARASSSPLKDTQPTDQSRSEQSITEHISLKQKDIPSSIGEVWEYAQTLNVDKGYALTTDDCEAFIDYHSSQGWFMKNGRKIKDWKAALRTWARNGKKYSGGSPSQEKRPKFVPHESIY